MEGGSGQQLCLISLALAMGRGCVGLVVLQGWILALGASLAGNLRIVGRLGSGRLNVLMEGSGRKLVSIWYKPFEM